MPIRSEHPGQENILVVDNDVRVIELLQITLSGRGYTVHTAFDGDTALAEVKHRNPALVVLDVRLPRKSGFQVLEAIRGKEETKNLPVILISGNSSNEARIQGLRMGADDYLAKPFSPRELIMKIRRILDRVADQKLLCLRNQALKREVRDQRQLTVQAHTDMQRGLMKIGTVLQRVELIHEWRSLSEIFEGFVQALVSELDIETVCLFVRDKHARLFNPEVWRVVSERLILNLSISVDSFFGQVVALEGRTMRLDEFQGYPRAAEDLTRLSAAGFTHLTPVRLGGEVVALIAGGDKTGGYPLDPIDLHLLSVLARSVATSIQNARVFDRIRKSLIDTTAQLVATVESRYESLKGHSSRVHDIAMRMAGSLSLPQRVRQTVSHTALLHDMGALEEYEDLFEGQKLLTDEQRASLRRRTVGGVRQILENAELPEVADAVYHLNEYWDGSGLPDGLIGEYIPLASRTVAVANAFDALTHPRPHRPAYTHEDAILILKNRAGHQFDPQLIEIGVRVLEEELDRAVTSPAQNGQCGHTSPSG